MMSNRTIKKQIFLQRISLTHRLSSSKRQAKKSRSGRKEGRKEGRKRREKRKEKKTPSRSKVATQSSPRTRP